MWAYSYEGGIGLDFLCQVDRPDPEPGAHDIVLRMSAVALNYRDYAIARGPYHVGVEYPLIPVSDGAGEVIAVGRAVTRFQVGDLACPTYLPDWTSGPVGPKVARRRLGGPTDGVLREFVCLNENEAVLAPKGYSAEEAATLPVAAVTAWHSLFVNGTVRPGQTVLVQGTGGVSLFALQFARLAGARVIALTRDDRHSQQLKSLGADEVVTESDPSIWPAEVVRLSGGGADVVVDVAGVTLAASIAATRPAGRVHLVGYAGGTRTEIDIYDAIRHAVTICLASAGNRDSFEALVAGINRGGIRPPIGALHRTRDLREPLEMLAAGGVFGKHVLTLDN